MNNEQATPADDKPDKKISKKANVTLLIIFSYLL